MSSGLEQEVKLEFASVEAARRSIQSTGARLVVSRRLLDDALYDTADQRLRGEGRALRLRRDGAQGLLTVKGPVLPGPVKTREEIETTVGDAATADALIRGLGYVSWFHAQKHREEYVIGDARLMLDETPVGVFIEIEATPDEIERVARLLGRSPDDYILASYPRLYRLRR